MAHEAHAGEAHGLNPRQYVIIFVVLSVITAVELAVSYSGAGFWMLLVVLGILSAVVGIVVALFMHLRFDNPFFTKMFLGPLLLLAASVLLALMTLGGYDAVRSVIHRG